MIFDPFASFPFEVTSAGRKYTGHIRPFPNPGQKFPAAFTVTVGQGMFFAHIRYEEKGWTSGGGAADPDVVRAIGDYIQALYE